MRTGIVLVVSFCLIAVMAAANPKSPKNSGPGDVVKAFYKYHFAHDMAFTPDGVKQRATWFTPGLINACETYFARPQDPDEVPNIDGDPFTGSQEYPNTFSAGPASIQETKASVPVTFSWKDHHSTRGTVILKKEEDGRWLIDDFEFPDQDSTRQLLAEQED